METTALQQLVKKVFSDENTRAEFEKDPEKIIPRFGLTELERNALLTTHTKLGLITAGAPKLGETTGPIGVWL